MKVGLMIGYSGPKVKLPMDLILEAEAALLVLDVTETDHISVREVLRHSFKTVEKDGLRVKGVEPPSRLVDGLADEICREAAVEFRLVLTRVVPLCVGHRPGVEPCVYHLGSALHRPIALCALQLDAVDVRSV